MVQTRVCRQYATQHWLPSMGQAKPSDIIYILQQFFMTKTQTDINLKEYAITIEANTSTFYCKR